jgi:hypothetical protein
MIRRFSYCLVLAWLSITATTSAYAVDYPYSFGPKEQNIDTHQVGHVKLSIDANGSGYLEDFWSNGQRVWGNTFYAYVVLVGKDGKPVWENMQKKGLNGSMGGRAVEGFVSVPFTLTKQQMDAFDHVDFKLGVMNCGMEMTSFHCCDHGIEVAMSTHKCGGIPKPRR